MEKELIEFKNEIEDKFKESKMNASYVYLRKSNQTHKRPKDFSSDMIAPSYTLNDKILMKNMNNYEKGLSGEYENSIKKNAYYEDANTFDYRVSQPDLTQLKEGKTFYSDNNDVSSELKIPKVSGMKFLIIPHVI